MSNTPRYARFGWYWQPEKWLKDMNSEDTLTATNKATGINATSKALQETANRQEAILKHLWDED